MFFVYFFLWMCNIWMMFVDVDDLDVVVVVVMFNLKVFYFELILNLCFVVVNIFVFLYFVYIRGLIVVVDNIFVLLLFFFVWLGVDVVVYSLLKYISGVGDIIVGVVCGFVEFISVMMDFYYGVFMLLGLIMDFYVVF